MPPPIPCVAGETVWPWVFFCRQWQQKKSDSRSLGMSSQCSRRALAVSPRLFPCFTSASYSPKLVFFLLVSHSPTPIYSLSFYSTPDLFVFLFHVSLFFSIWIQGFFNAQPKVTKKKRIDRKWERFKETHNDPTVSMPRIAGESVFSLCFRGGKETYSE